MTYIIDIKLYIKKGRENKCCCIFIVCGLKHECRWEKGRCITRRKDGGKDKKGKERKRMT